MKNLNEQIHLKYLLIFSMIIFIILAISYIFIKSIILDPSNDASVLLSYFSIVFFILGASIIFIFLVSYYFLKKQNDRLVEDVEHLSGFVNEISEKVYDSNVKIKYYSEFLKISINLKNIVKRLNKKS